MNTLIHTLAHKKRGLNLQKAAEIMIYEFRAGTLGRIMLKMPGEYAQWLSAGRQVKKDKIETRRLIKLKNIPRPLKTGAHGA